MEEVIKYYTNGEVTIVWKPNLCTHASFCWKELPEVFNPKNRPWVNAMGADTDRIIKQVERCPSGALTHFMNNNEQTEKESTKKNDCDLTANIMKNGPLVIPGGVCVKCEGKEDKNNPHGAAFCRCGKSRNQPYCDGSHVNFPFE